MKTATESKKGLLNSLVKAKIRTYKKAVQEINKSLSNHSMDLCVWFNENTSTNNQVLFYVLKSVTENEYNELNSWRQVHLMDSEGVSTYYQKIAGFNELDPLFEYLESQRF